MFEETSKNPWNERNLKTETQLWSFCLRIRTFSTRAIKTFLLGEIRFVRAQKHGENGFEFEARKRWHARRRRCRWFESLETAARLLVKGRAGNAPEFRRIMKLTRPTSVPKAPTLFAYRDVKLLSRAFYGFESSTKMERWGGWEVRVSTFEKTSLVYVLLYILFSRVNSWWIHLAFEMK